MKSSYFNSLFKQDSSDFVQKSGENSPNTTITTNEPQAISENVVINIQDKQPLTDDYHKTTNTTAKKHRDVFAQPRVKGVTTQDCYRDIFTNRLQKAARGLPITLPELIYWFECDKAQINDLSLSDKALRVGVASYVKYGLGRELRATSKQAGTNDGMNRCLQCYYWLGDWCSNQDISTGSRNSIDANRWRRCKGFSPKNE